MLFSKGVIYILDYLDINNFIAILQNQKLRSSSSSLLKTPAHIRVHLSFEPSYFKWIVKLTIFMAKVIPFQNAIWIFCR